ncbi:MAG: NUDIX domain-containing protein [Saccharofermentanales bacterium]
MLIRNCAGGIVFNGDKVLILKNEKSEWVFPKGVIRSEDSTESVAMARVKLEAGVDAAILGTAGMTNYEFYSVSRQRPVCNKITWFVMSADTDACTPNTAQNFTAGGFYSIEKAADLITYSQDKSLLMVSYQKYLNDRNGK